LSGFIHFDCSKSQSRKNNEFLQTKNEINASEKGGKHKNDSIQSLTQQIEPSFAIINPNTPRKNGSKIDMSTIITFYAVW